MIEARQTLSPSEMLAYTFRLRPGEDLYASIQQFAADQLIQAGCVLACAGSLTTAVLRLANHDETTTYSGRFEIVSLS